MIEGTLLEANVFQAMGLGLVVIEDPFGMSLTESSVERRWWARYDVGVFDKKLSSTLCDQRQFICRVTSLHLPHLDH